MAGFDIDRLKAEADALKSVPRLAQEEALRALETAMKQRLGDTGQLSANRPMAITTITIRYFHSG